MISLFSSILLATTGLIALAVGAEALVFGASWLARVLRISPAVVGLTIVAFATSVPELCVSLIAINQDSVDIAVGICGKSELEARRTGRLKIRTTLNDYLR